MKVAGQLTHIFRCGLDYAFIRSEETIVLMLAPFIASRSRFARKPGLGILPRPFGGPKVRRTFGFTRLTPGACPRGLAARASVAWLRRPKLFQTILYAAHPCAAPFGLPSLCSGVPNRSRRFWSNRYASFHFATLL